jgi:hypothetical protein
MQHFVFLPSTQPALLSLSCLEFPAVVLPNLGMAEDRCACCWEPMHAPAGDLSFLFCGHRYHTVCAERARAAAGTCLHDFPCPECRRTARQLSQTESDVLAQAAPAVAVPKLAPARPFHVSNSQGVHTWPALRVRSRSRSSGLARRANGSTVAESSTVLQGLHGAPAGELEADPIAPASPVVSARVETPDSQQTGNSPTLRNASMRFHFRDTSARAGDDVALIDPMEDLTAKMNAASNVQNLDELIHPVGLFEGHADAGQAYRTTMQMLDEITADTRSHIDVAGDLGFTLEGLVPQPFLKSIDTICKREGWSPEGLHQGLLTNIGWLEATDTRLILRQGDDHTRSTAVPGFGAMPPSYRKSSEHKFIVRRSVDVENAPDEIRQGLCQVREGTLRGHRTNLYNYSRSGIATDEASTTYKTRQTEDTQSLHLQSRGVMCTFVNCERDACVTGAQPDHNDSYNFYHSVWGQHEPVTEILLPRPGGFSKRFHMFFVTRRPHWCPSQVSEVSQRFWLDFHNWMCQFCLPAGNERRARNDTFALVLMDSVLEACTDFLAQRPGLNAHFAEKIAFADSDLAKFANCAMRMTQFCRSRSAVPQENPAHTGAEWTVLDMMYAIRTWHRQLRYHHGIGTLAPQAPTGNASAFNAGNAAAAELSEDDKLLRWILVHPRNQGEQSSAQVRLWLKNKLHGDVKDRIAKAIQRLADDGCVELVESPAGEDGASQRRRGHRVVRFVKKPWRSIWDNADAKALLQRLEVGADAF